MNTLGFPNLTLLPKERFLLNSQSKPLGVKKFIAIKEGLHWIHFRHENIV